MIKFFVAAAVALSLVGCASSPNVQQYTPSRQVVHFPSVGVETETEIGQTLVSKANLAMATAVTIDVDISENIKQSVLNNRWSGDIKIPAGKYVKTSESPEGSFYRSLQGYYDSTAGRTGYPVGVFVPNSASSPAVPYVYHAVVGSTGFEFGVKPVKYSATTSESWSKDSFKNELIYGGLSQKTISVSYREYIDGTARPAFSQEIKYDLNESDIIGFRGARFQVIKTSNTNIKYKMLKPLD